MLKNKKDKRDFVGSIRINLDGEKTLFEIADASLYDGSFGFYRVREDRGWLMGFHSKKGLLKIIEEKMNKGNPNPKPDLKAKDSVRVHYKHDGIDYHKTILSTDPILNYEGIWVAPVFIYGLGLVYVNCEDMTLLRRVKRFA